RDDRWEPAQDVVVQLKWVAGGGSLAGVPAPVTARRKTYGRLGWISAAVFFAAALLLAILHFREVPPERSAARFVISPPGQMTIGLGPAAPQAALSPDGRYLVVSMESAGNKRNLWLRRMDSVAFQVLAGTEEASLPFWSPDSRSIGFFAQEKLRRISITGGSPQTLCDVPNPNGGTWNREGVILFAATGQRGLARVSASGGVASEVTTPDRGRMEHFHSFPQFLPDGRHFLFFSLSEKREARGIFVASLGSEERRQILQTDSRAIYTPPGFLLFLRQGTLMAQRFDPDRLRLTGEPVRVADAVAYNPFNSRTTITASDNGILAYRAGPGSGVPTSELAWFDRQGKRIGTAVGRGFYVRPRLSPEGQRIVVEKLDLQESFRDLWLVDVARSTVSRLTFGPSSQSNAVWSPDGTRVVFVSDRDNAYGLYEKLSSGAGDERLLRRSGSPMAPTDWSADGRFIAYTEVDAKTKEDLWVLPVFGDRKPMPLLRTPFIEGQGRFSPDGKWIAYASDESGRREIYVQSFPPSGAKWQISTDGGSFPEWRGDGRELFYFGPDQKLMSVEIGTGSTLSAGKPQALFGARYFRIPISPYTVSSDGRKFLIVSPTEDESNSAPLTVVLNWTAELKR